MTGAKPGAKPRSGVGNVHYYYMDALRAAFMITGLFVHASMLGDDPIFDGIGYASSLVRMEGFFVISGFLSAMLVRRYGTGPTVRRRLTSVGLPFLATLVLCNPLALWLEYNFHNPDVPLAQYLRGDVPESVSPQIWLLNLWFLASLLLYALCTPAASALLTRLSTTAAFDWAARSRPRAITGIVVFVVATTVVGRGLHKAVVEPVVGSTPFDFLVEVTIEFLPFFLTGLLLYMGDQRLLASFRRPAPLLLAVSGCALLAAEQEWVGALATSTVKVLIETVLAVALIATLLAVAEWLVPRQRPAVRYMADASYTIYLFHFVWIFIFATAFSFDPTARWPQMLLVTSLTFAVTLAVHHYLVLRSSLLRAVFNGKFTVGRHRAVVPVKQHVVVARQRQPPQPSPEPKRVRTR